MNIKNYFATVLLFLTATLVANELLTDSSALFKDERFSFDGKFWNATMAENNSIRFIPSDTGKNVKITQQKDSSYSLIYQQIEVKPQTEYTLSFEIKTDNVKVGVGGIGARTFISGEQTLIETASFKGSHDWTKQKYTFNSQNNSKISIYFYLHKSSGSVEFRQINLKEASFSTADKINTNLIDWQTSAGKEATVEVDNSVPYNGKPSIKIGHVKHSTTRLKQLVKVEPNTNYVLTAIASAKAPMVPGGDYPYSGYTGFRPMVLDEKGEVLALGEPGGGLYFWRESSIAFNSKNNRKITLELHFLDSKGVVHVGEVKLVKATSKDIGDITPPDNSSLDFVSKEVKESGFIPFVMGAMEQAYSTRKPQAKEINVALKANAAIGEIEGISLGIYAFKPLEDVKLKFKGDLVAATGKTFRINNFLINYINNDKFKLDDLRYYELPAFLYPGKPLNIRADHSQRYMINCEIPADAEAGLYKGELEISASNAPTKTVNFELNIYPFKLDEAKISYLTYYDPRLCKVLKNASDPTVVSERTGKDEAAFFADMKKHNMNTITLYGAPSLDANGHLQIEEVASTIERALAAGVVSKKFPILFLYNNPKDWTATFCPPFPVMKKIIEEQKKRNWPEFLFYAVDEPDDAARVKEVRELFTKLKSENINTPMITAIGDYGLQAGLAELYDTMIVNVSANRILEKSREGNLDKKIMTKWWSYECAQNGLTPEVDRYMTGIMSYALGVDGFAQWAYAQYDRLKDSAAIPTYGYVLILEDGLHPSLGYEAEREGIDDRRYIDTLTRLIEENPNNPSVQEAKQFLQTIKQKVDIDALKKRADNNFARYVRTYNKAQEDLDSAQLDAWRQKIAAYIIKLSIANQR